MSGPIGTPMTSPLPTPSVTAGPTWATQLVTFLTEVKAYLEAKVGNASIDLGSDASVKHSTVDTRDIPAAAGACATAGNWNSGTLQYWQAAGTGAAHAVDLPIPLAINERLKSVTVTGRAAGVTGWTLNVYKIDKTTGTATLLGTATSAITAAIADLTVSGLTETAASHISYYAEWVAGASGNRCYGGSVTVDKVTTP